MNIFVQEQLPAWYFARYNRAPAKVDIQRASDWVAKALRQTKRSPEREFEGRGFNIIMADLSWPAANGGVRLRARLSLRTKEILLNSLAEAELHQRLETLGFAVSPSPRDVILAHELFHLFCPKCPSNLTEMAAHLYAAELLNLSYYPGILDISSLYGVDNTLIA